MDFRAHESGDRLLEQSAAGTTRQARLAPQHGMGDLIVAGSLAEILVSRHQPEGVREALLKVAVFHG